MIGIYCRVSTLQQADKYSLGIQEKRGIAFANTEGEGHLVYREAESGSSLIGRDQLKQLFQDIERSLVNKVWVIEFSRISRDVEDATYIKNLFLKNKCLLYEDGRLMDLTRPESLLSYHVTSAVSEYERSRLIERVRRAKIEVVNKGKKTFGRLYGYKLQYKPDGSREWIVVKEEAEFVQQVYRLYEEGLSHHAIMRKVNDEGYRSRQGTIWLSTQIGRILRHLEYTGHTRNKADEIISSTVYKPIIPLEKWRRVQAAQAKANPTRNFRTRFQKDHLATGLIRCGECGVAYYINNLNRKAKAYRYYAHSTKKECHQKPTLLGYDLMNSFFSYIFIDTYTREGELQKYLALKEAKIAKEQQNVDANTERLQKRLKELGTQRARLVAAIANGTIEPDDAAERMTTIRTEQHVIQKKLSDSTASFKTRKKELEDLTEELSESQLKEFKKGTVSQKRKMVQRLVKSAVLTGDLLKVFTVTDKKYALKVKNTPKQILKIIEKARA